MKSNRALVICILVTLLAAVPFASAAEERYAEFSVDGQVSATATTELVHFGGSGVLQMDGTGNINWGDYFVTRTFDFASGAVLDPSIGDPTACDDPYAVFIAPTIDDADPAYCSEHQAIDAVQLADVAASAVAGHFQVRLYGNPSSMTVGATMGLVVGRGTSGVAASGGADYHDLSEEDVYQSNQNPKPGVLPFFATRALDNSAVLLESSGTRNQIEVTGDFTIEISGLEVAVAGSPTADSWETGWHDASAVKNDAVANREHRFLRFSMSDATLSFSLSEGNNLGIAADSMVVQSTNAPMHLQEEAGQVTLDLSEDGQTPAGDRVVPAPFRAEMTPSGRDMMVDIESSSVTTPEAPPILSRDWFQTVLWIAAALLFVGAVAMVAVRASTSPPIPSIEAALEGGKFRKAARLSSRLLRRDPTQESAQLARAIAWSRMGAHDRIVRHLEPFLRQNEPSDGTIHYVLGLAQHELGHADEAREAMAAAVTRTPSLLTDIDPTLRMTEREPTGYS